MGTSGLKAAIGHSDHLWAAGAIALACPAVAVMAVRRRREEWAFAAGLGLHLATSLVVWNYHVQNPLADWWVLLLQANILASSAGALVWLAARKWIYGREELTISFAPLLAAQLGILVLGNVALWGLPLLVLFFLPHMPLPPTLAEAGEWWGGLALLTTTAAALWYTSQVDRRKWAHVVFPAGLAFGVCIACAFSPWDTGNWLSYHLLTGLWSATGLLALAVGCIGVAYRRAGVTATRKLENDRLWSVLSSLGSAPTASQIRRWADTIGLAVLGLALRGAWEDTLASAAATLVVSVLAAGLALWTSRPRYVYISGLLFSVAGSLAWLSRGADGYAQLFSVNIVCLATASLFWTVVELVLRPGPLRVDLRGKALPFSHAAAGVALAALASLAALALATRFAGENGPLVGPVTWMAVAATFAALAACLWDADAKFAVAGLYIMGHAIIGLTVSTTELPAHELGWYLALALAVYTLLVTLAGWAIPRLAWVWRTIRLPDRSTRWPEPWFYPAQTGTGCLVVATSIWMAMSFETFLERLGGPIAVAILLPACLLGVRQTTQRWATGLRYATLGLGVMLLADLNWALLNPGTPAVWMHRTALLLAAVAAMTVIYGVGLRRLLPGQSAWSVCCRRIGPILEFVAVALVTVVLVQEILRYDAELKRTPMLSALVAVVAVAQIGLLISAICFAVMPGRDPFRLSERGRTVYVYAAELLLVFLFVHLRLNLPWLFPPLGAARWAFLIMVIAFTGVGLSELFRRMGLRVLAGPLQRTGVFLPLLPLIAFWARPPAVVHEFARQWLPGMQPLLVYLDRLPNDFGIYAVLWFLLGLIYTVVALGRRSSRFALFAVLATNAGLWALLHHHSWAFLVHPQFWLIPLALIALVAEHLNRDRLSTYQSGTLRYLALSIIYVSSTADMFIAGLDNSVLWPLLLAILCVLGVLAGILLQVRAFLFQGVTFLLLVIFTMIWHAAVDHYQTWVWWVSGIVLGAAILALFAVFEKRRNDVLRMLEQIKQWS